MSYEGGLNSLVAEIREASQNLTAGDARMNQRLDGIERSVNETLPEARPSRRQLGDEGRRNFRAQGRGQALSEPSRVDRAKKIDAGVLDDYTPTSGEIDEALIHRKAMKALLRHGDMTRLEPTFQKSLSAFSFDATGFLLAPEMSNRVLRCIVDPTDVAGLVDRVAISAPSIRFPIDNSRMMTGGWACEASCWANNPQPDLSEALGTLQG